MKRITWMLTTLFLSGCAMVQRECTSLKADMIALDRIITVYGADGTVLKRWDTRTVIAENNGCMWFLHHGKMMGACGTVIAEEK